MSRVDALARHNVDFPSMGCADQRSSAKFAILERDCLVRAQRLNSLNDTIVGMNEQDLGPFDLHTEHFPCPELVEVRDLDEVPHYRIGIIRSQRVYSTKTSTHSKCRKPASRTVDFLWIGGALSSGVVIRTRSGFDGSG